MPKVLRKTVCNKSSRHVVETQILDQKLILIAFHGPEMYLAWIDQTFLTKLKDLKDLEDIRSRKAVWPEEKVQLGVQIKI